MTDSVTEEHSTVTRTTDSIRLMAWLAAVITIGWNFRGIIRREHD